MPHNDLPTLFNPVLLLGPKNRWARTSREDPESCQP
jgi:hypothetical protein